MLSFLGKDYEYEWPEPVPLERRLKDVLEDEVDEKYYINNEKADRLIQGLAERNVLPLDEKPKESPDYLGNYYGRHSGYDGSVFGTNAPCKTITSSLGGGSGHNRAGSGGASNRSSAEPERNIF